MMLEKNVLVTGSTGYLGKSLVNKLLALGFNVTGLSRSSSEIKHEHYTHLKKTIDESLKLGHFDIIFHMAGVGHRYTQYSHYELIQTNVCGLENTLRAIENPEKVLFFYPSSSSVYGDNSKKNSPVNEGACLRPKSSHGQSKLKSEQVLSNFSDKTGMKTIIARIFNVYGGHDKGSIVEKIIHSITRGTTMPLDRNLWRDFIHIDDLVSSIVRLSRDSSGIFNMGSGVATRIGDLVEYVEHIFDRKLKHSPFETEVQYIVSCPDKLQSVIGMPPSVDMKEYIDSVFESFKIATL
jgi:nucleoside-diphosphate-sugar epimerase